MTAADDTRTEIAGVLETHQKRQRLTNGRWALCCRCGDWMTDDEYDERAEEQDELHRAHVADVLAEYVATKQAEAVREAANLVPQPALARKWLRDRADRIAP